jgi:2-phospho-L-lactate/phosphoenolpyruvate guanylyltransferase
LTCWALIPVKAAAQCKSRLADALEPLGRADLVERMLQNVIAAALGARLVDRVSVVTPAARKLSKAVLTVRDEGSGLIPALEIARRAAVNAGARQLLVLPADLPLLTAAVIDGFLEQVSGLDVATALDRTGLGTNALWLRAALPFEFRFGVDSARLHRQEAERLALTVASLSVPSLDFDVDTPNDFHDLTTTTRFANSAPGLRSAGVTA